MPKYIYEVRDGTGQGDTGALVAADLQEALRELRKDGKVIVRLQESSSGESHSVLAAGRKVGRQDIIYFATQLAIMVDTGVPLSEALDAILEQTDQPGLKALVSDISEQVKGGMEFSKALERHPQEFSKLFVALMKASEASGTMGMMLQRVSDYMVQERETIKRIKGAMIYPMFMLGFCVLAVVGLLVFVLPKFATIYRSKGAILPLPTRILLGMSEGIRDYWYLLLALVVAAVVGCVFFARSAGGRIILDRWRVSMPVLGSMYRKACIARSLRTMSTMVSTGVSILDGLRITGEIAGNHFYQQMWTDVAEKIKEGSSMSEELRDTKLIPRTISQMISAGEKTGKLSLVMNRVAEFCEEDLKVAVKTLTSLIEPAMIVIMGLLVGGIALALLLPIFSLSKIVAH